MTKASPCPTVIRRAAQLAAVTVAFVALQGGSCRGGGPASIPTVTSPQYREAVRAFFVGLAALQAGDLTRAQTELTNATKAAPGEPAAWANLAILELRGQRTDDALKHLQQARDLAPENGDVIYLHALAKAQKGDFAAAAADYRTVAQKDPKNLRARYALMEQIQQSGGPEADAESRKLLEELASIEPDNLVVQLELARLSAKSGDLETLKEMTGRIARSTTGWPEGAAEQLAALQAAAAAGNARGATTPVLYLKNLLVQLPRYRTDIAALKTPVGEVGQPIVRLLKLPNPPAAIAAPDGGLTFEPEQAGGENGAGRYAMFFVPSREAKPGLVRLTDSGIALPGASARLPFPGGASSGPIQGQPLAAADLNSDYRTDLVAAGASGLKIYVQSADGSFTDATPKSRLPSSITTASLRGVWSADVDLDGDLDLLVSPTAGATTVLRNNADGSYSAIQPFAGSGGAVDFGWADFDDDGDPDGALLDDGGRLHIQTNERAGQFRVVHDPAGVSGLAAFAILDSDDNGRLDIVALKQDGALVRLERDPASDAPDAWKSAEISRWEGAVPLQPGNSRLLAADLDNNGGIDLIASGGAGTMVWLHGPGGAFSPPASAPAGRALAAADANGDGRIDLVGLAADGRAATFTNQGKLNYGWQQIRPQAATARGDQRINSFGIGGNIEVRAGFLTQRQVISSPVVHFGIGQAAGIDAARIIWPNGSMQAEFAIQPNQAITTVQRLKGSCPWMFAWDGKEMAFVTDTLWRSPLGLRINAQDTGPVAMTEDWVRIPGDRLAPRDGAYDIRVTAELWETHFFDHVSLLAVDHPAGTEMWVDERFAIPPPKVGVIITKPSVPVARATDDQGTDVTAIVRDIDSEYLDTFGRGYYQGVTRDHYVEVELGSGVPDRGPLWLIGQGWIHPTDSSINVAIAQGSHPKPRDLSLEVPDGKGGWRVAKPHLGFPAGKTKSILIDLSGVFRPGEPKKLRLRTNLEIYWDRLSWAAGADAGPLSQQRIQPDSADLRYRGYSSVSQANPSSPLIPDYEWVFSTTPRWCDLVGYHTRFGDVRELLRKVDDRYVIMNAGDEMLFRFPVPAPPPAGYVRDFVLISDGWEKDGDLNTGFSKTVLPLPSHADPYYKTPPTILQNDPVYRRYPRDWQVYHTRYVTPERYWSALRTKASP